MNRGSRHANPRGRSLRTGRMRPYRHCRPHVLSDPLSRQPAGLLGSIPSIRTRLKSQKAGSGRYRIKAVLLGNAPAGGSAAQE